MPSIVTTAYLHILYIIAIFSITGIPMVTRPWTPIALETGSYSVPISGLSRLPTLGKTGDDSSGILAARCLLERKMSRNTVSTRQEGSRCGGTRSHCRISELASVGTSTGGDQDV